MMELEGKRALITGSSRGIGKAIALAFAKAGADIVVNCVREIGKARMVADEIQQLGRRAVVFQADISDRDAVRDMVEKTCEEFGGIDILVNNAAIVNGELMLELAPETWYRQFAVNIHGTFHCTQEVAQRMITQHKGGKIINVTSICGLIALERRSAYSATKGAIQAFTRCCALELAPYDIQVNALSPGATNTEINIPLYTPAIRKALAQRIAAGRIAEPEDIAGTAVFLASPPSAYVTGQIISVDGGWSTLDYTPYKEYEMLSSKNEQQGDSEG